MQNYTIFAPRNGNAKHSIYMEATESLVKIIKSLEELAIPVGRPLLVDFLMGKDSREITGKKLDEKEFFGCGDEHDEDYWSSVIDAALEQGFLKFKNIKAQTLQPTPAGKKFAKKPTSFTIEDESDISDIPAEKGLDEIVKNAIEVKVPTENEASPRTKQQIKLIHAIDYKVALDDFAENEGLGLDEVLEEAEKLVHQGRPLDITYFTDEVMGEDCVSELVDYFRNAPNDSIDDAMEEYGDVYNDMEIRLARLVYRVQQLGKKK